MMDNVVKVVCKCIPGFERICINECKEKLDINESGTDMRGRIYFHINISKISTLQTLRSVSHYWVVVSEHENYFSTHENNETLFAELVQLPTKISWEKAMKTWKEFKMNYEKKPRKKQPENKSEDISNGQTDMNISDKDGEKHSDAIEEELPKKDLTDIAPLTAGDALSFRVTAYRTGKHGFGSMEAAKHLGSGVNDTFHWKVDMTKFDIEIVLYILNDNMSIGIQLTRDDQANRNITHFGPTTLRASICYNLLKYAQVVPGDIVCDPMCGSSSISIEGTLSCPNSFHLAGENHAVAMEHSADNVRDIEKEKHESYSLPVSIVRWDVYQLPLRTNSVDKIITDLPFGKRIGNKDRNMFLYPVVLREMARIIRPKGKAVLLTQHKGAIARAVKNSDYWQTLEVRKMLMGGLDVVAYLLTRTDEVYAKLPEKPKTEKVKKNEKQNEEKDTSELKNVINQNIEMNVNS